MYQVTQIVISKNKYPELYTYLDHNSRLAKNLYNAALFRVRQLLSGWDKTDRTENEVFVFSELDTLLLAYPGKKLSKWISYTALEKLMRATHNPDYFAGLPMQSAQGVLKQVIQDRKSWLSALKDYTVHPERYLGKPRMPHYRKQPTATYTITNQDAVLYTMEDGRTELKLPGTRYRLQMSHIPGDADLREVKVLPYYGRFILSLTIRVEEISSAVSGQEIAGIDFGTDNIAAIVCTDSSSRLYKGGAILSENQFFAKRRAQAVSMITHGHSGLSADSAHLRNLSFHHANFVRDQLHKISTSVVAWCQEHSASTLVLGKNVYWKQSSNIGRQNNQKFVSMPITKLQDMICMKAAAAGINVVIQEESYTSKADISGNDAIPVYGEENGSNPIFSGRRICRGLYRCADGTSINADCNAAANIIRKAFPDAWNRCSDFTWLAFPEPIGFRELNPH